MKALVTGATGFIGSHLVEELVKQGYSVTCLVRTTSDLQWIEGFPVNFVKGGCITEEEIDYIFNDYDYIFHLAGVTKARKQEEFFCINADGTENIINATLKYNKNIKRFVYVSTLAVAGPAKECTPLTNTLNPAPVSDYGRSKLKAEEIVLSHKNDIPITIIRPPAVYGPRDRDFYLIFKMIKKGLFPYWGKSYFSLIYVEDLVKGIVKSVTSDNTIGNVYYLSDAVVHTNEELADTIAKAFNCNYLKVKIPKRIMPTFASLSERILKKSIINTDKIKELNYEYWLCSPEKAKDDFGFETTVNLKDGIKWTANWYKIHKWL
ncbi:nucleoside-diphosphate sugar epimerase [Candidatus Magnetoovum chiemensis]|nr:nucleoside-diphosphate sugar epimerase [Candidatus Magnetoovum chiemensis]